MTVAGGQVLLIPLLLVYLKGTDREEARGTRQKGEEEETGRWNRTRSRKWRENQKLVSGKRGKKTKSGKSREGSIRREHNVRKFETGNQ